MVMNGTETVEEIVTITKGEYVDLLAQVKFLGCLEDAGVDNWGGYDHAQDMMGEWPDA
jgi:hypothetical protein|tara:strand:+ start:1827 stop:2000 length:174 start_codon:yes stop_codon:yes gene_type:complete